MKPEVASRRIESFGQRFGEAHLYLAYHAAFPLALTPDLLYRLWPNFQRDIHGEALNIPWLAVADLLLSSLCDEVGYELYEMDTAVRNLLLRELKSNSRFGEKRINELSDFLLIYVREQIESHDPDIRDFAQAQRWTALAYTRPSEAASELALALSKLKLEEKAEWVRMTYLVETFAEPLVGFEPLLVYARGVKHLAFGDLVSAKAEISKIPNLEGNIKIASVSLVVPEPITNESLPIKKSRKLKLDLVRFFQACNPSKTLAISKPEDRQYYIDFSTVRSGKIINELGRAITRFSPNEPTCQLFTGHIGCGKSTELLRLKSELEQQGFHVVYFESSQNLDMADVDVTDILLATASEVSQSLEAINIKIDLKPKYFHNLFSEIVDFLQTPIEIGVEAELSLGIGKITAKTKHSPKLRSQLRQYLEPRTNSILQSINQELLEPAIAKLKQQGKKGLVVINDNLDRIDNSLKSSGHTLPEYLFVERGEKLSQLNCHVIYTIPLGLIFSNALGRLTNRFGIDPKVLPMVPVKLRDGKTFEKGIILLQQMVMARAFPGVSWEQSQYLITEVFDSLETLERLCLVSGGHLRNLLMLLFGCLQQDDPPITRECLDGVIKQRCNQMTSAITPDEWKVLREVAQDKSLRGHEKYELLLHSMFVLEYRNEDGLWFDINPILAEAKELRL